MIEPLLKSQLEPVARRTRQWRLWRAQAICWGAGAAAGLFCLLLRKVAGLESAGTLPVIAIAAALATVIVSRRARKWQPDFREMARQIEQQQPGLHALLLTAVEQEPDPQTGELSYLQKRVVREAISASGRERWVEAISDGRMRAMGGIQFAALAALVAVLLSLRVTAPTAGENKMVADHGVTVTPGDASVERGHGLVVLARFTGPLPAEAALVIGSTPEASRRIPLVKNLADPVFGGSIPEVMSNFTYHVEFAGRSTRIFQVTVFEHPKLERADATIQFPEYTGRADKRIEDTRRISAVEGSRLDLALQLNKPVASARLVARDKSVVPLVVHTNQPRVTLEKLPLETSKTYQLELVDAEGRTNKVASQFVIDVLKNRAPELKISAPRGDQRVSPLEEVAFQGEAWDDFGLRAYGLSYSVGGGEVTNIVLGDSTAAGEKRPFRYLLPLETLSAQPDQLISWFVWSDDVGPDGNVRRTASDMYFAEVRPFEEIFREGQSPEGQESQQQQQQQQGNQATRLAELQKQIINATWKLQRQEAGRTNSPPSLQYRKDEPVVLESQQKAMEQAEALKERASDPRAELLIGNVLKEMEKALDQLTRATNSIVPLPAALAAEQSAYQALLKLAAREYQVSQSRNQRSRGASAGQPNQRQLEELDLKQAENKYETQRQASPQQNSEQREQLQVQNRLKELAQRQQDLNERIKELQNSLQEAKTDEEKEEIRRRLKRLREEEQEMLADVDELRQRMEQPQNQSKMAEARQQLDQTRSEVQKATEALEKESASQALAAGTRAQRDLQELRDEFRRKNSKQFSDEMRERRNEARELAQNQEEIGRKLAGLGEPVNKPKSLTDSGEKKMLADDLAKQQRGLTNLLGELRTLSEQTETAEPLLSQQLYDTLRKTEQAEGADAVLPKQIFDMLRDKEKGSVENSLGIASELLDKGAAPLAEKVEQHARQQIDELKKGVERAAETVLGDDTEALRMAKRELDELTRQLENEIARDPASRAAASGGGLTPNQQTNLLLSANGAAGTNTPQSSGAGQQTNSGPASQSAGNKEGQPRNSQQDAQQSGQQAQDSQGRNSQGQNSRAQSGEQASQTPNGRAPGDSQRGQQPGDGQQSQSPGQQSGQGTQASQDQQRAGQEQAGNPQARSGGQRAARGGGEGGNRQPDAARDFFDAADSNRQGGGGGTGPITGENFINWSDRLRDVEEMIDQPDLRNDVARIRERARAMRGDFKRQGKTPERDQIKLQLAAPLAEVRSRVVEELARRESKDALVPIDRDPVPSRFSELVRRYYEKLGSE